ncbi:M24 family metallopeptidase [Candidatus Halobonum tyrrellensis]|uniref:Peptidase M24 n=1 Tax=Candidatus Halobonum tyrrellensis G22 TaxID=1324957 RepID=V4HEX9_9EURY|nr:Xaa-Pro peptidase family protein [Candidatus Halobonum tyrrellensis]ESP88678.1 peptidase M24 [Candidatus Halobonum tyrrellensis G22]
MDPDLSTLDDRLDAAGVDAYCLDAASTEPNQLYLSGFDAPDPFFTAYALTAPDGTGELAVLVSGLEYGRAKKESRADAVARLADYDYHERVGEYGEREGTARTYAAFLADLGVESALVPDRFPVGVADGLREAGVGVGVDGDDVVESVRAVKTDEEVEHVRRAQEANEAALRAAEELIAGAGVADDGTLTHEGEPLTSERVSEEIEVTLLRHGCALDETIVAGGADAADPHDRGSGPLSADEAIVIDVFPRDKASKYHSDMTRTFLKGEPSDEIRDRYDLTEEALEAALAAVEPGATGADVHAAACDVYEAAGHPTLRSDPTTETGYIHSTGHGVGLAVHERPGLNPRGGALEPGHVITVEPGLYDPAVGGVRIEDIVVVTEDGYENLTDYPVELVVG